MSWSQAEDAALGAVGIFPVCFTSQLELVCSFLDQPSIKSFHIQNQEGGEELRFRTFLKSTHKELYDLMSFLGLESLC